MPLTVRQVPFGRPATDALGHVVATAQADDPLAPVTVIVPSNIVGITVRRLLGSGALGHGERLGLANVTVSTPHQLATHLGGASVAAEGVPLTNPVLAAAARRALHERPGRLRDVAGHPATEQAVVRLYGELSHVSPQARQALRVGGSELTADLLDLVDAVHAHLTGFSDEDDVARAATAAVRGGAGPALGTVVLHLLTDLSPSHAELIDALAATTDVVALVGATGDAAADGALRAPVEVPAAPAPIEPPTVTHIESVADPDEEVRSVVRAVAGRAERGVPLDRIVVLYPTEHPYARALHEQFDAAGIAWNGPSAGRLATTVAGRTLARFLGLAAADFGRDAVIDLVSGAPVRGRDGRPVAAARWDRLSRQAGVIAGADDWRDKLGSLADRLATDVATAERDDEPGRRARIQSDLDDVGSMSEFVDWLLATARPPSAGGWSQRARWAQEALVELLGPEPRRGPWPDHEHEAAAAVAAVLERVSVLDPVDPGPTAEAFARAVDDELDAPTGRRGRVGVGVLLAPLAAAAGLDADVVIVLGLAEGTCPAPRNEDSLLPDRARALAGGELPLRADRVRVDHAALLAGLAAGRDERILVHPRGDHRTGRARLPSRWLLDAAGRLAGRTVHSSDYDELVHPAVARVESYPAGLGGRAAPASVSDLDVRTLAAAPDPLAVTSLLGSDGLDRGLEATAARLSPRFTRFDGNLADVALPDPTERGPQSASRIETWAGCPFRYYLGYVLGLGEVERPERITEIAALDRGSLVHTTLERFGREVLDRPTGSRPAAGEGWAPADRDRLVEIAREVCAEYEALGITGRPLLWRLTRDDLLADFATFLDHDADLRAELGTSWEGVEVAFGMEGATPVEITLADGRVARFRGLIDRVDRRADGEAVVIDYKTGRLRRESAFREIEDDPVVRGTKVQLALYAEAVRQHHGAERPTTRYWFATSDGGFEDVGFDVTPESRERLHAVVDLAVRNIEAGVFPARSGEHDFFWGTHEQCGWCEFDRLCPRDRHERWTAKAEAPELAEYRALAEPDDEDPSA